MRQLTPTTLELVQLTEEAAQVSPDGGAYVEQRKTPLREFRILRWGTNATTHGPIEFSREDAATLMTWYADRYAARDGWIDMDDEHRSWKDDATSEDLFSVGRFRLDLRDDGLWAVEVTYQPETYEAVACGKKRSFSIVADLDEDGHVRTVRQLGLTNRPAANDAGLIAANERGLEPQGGSSMPAQTDPAAPPQDPRKARLALLAEALSYNERMAAVSAALDARFCDSYRYLEQCFDDHVIACFYQSGLTRGSTRYYSIDYTISADNIVTLAEPVEVRQSYVAVQKADELALMTEKHRTAHEKLTTLTEKSETSALIVVVEGWKRDAERAVSLAERVKTLETERLETARTTLLADAHRDNKWTANLEQQADATVDMAVRLNEDPVQAMRLFWERAPQVIAPGGAIPPQMPDRPAVPVQGSTGEVKLTEEDERGIALAAQQFPGLTVEQHRTLFLNEKRRLTGQRSVA